MLSLLANGWAAYSFAATLAGGVGLVMIVVALVLTAYLPAFLRHLLIGVGLAVLVGSALLQVGQQRGAHAQLELDAARAIQAEKDRTAAARRVTEALAVQATRDIAASHADNAKLKDLLDDVRKRADAARVCLPRDLSRRLRAF